MRCVHFQCKNIAYTVFLLFWLSVAVNTLEVKYKSRDLEGNIGVSCQSNRK